jgi:DNA-directed RNA polymerase specialized sigma24 family protein
MDGRAATNEQMLTWAQAGQKREAADALPQISALAVAHSALLFRVAFSVLRNASEAEDTVQDTFLRVLKHRGKLESIENPRVWLVRIALNLALDRKRRLRTAPLAEEAEALLPNVTSGEIGGGSFVRGGGSCQRAAGDGQASGQGAGSAAPVCN